MKLKHVKKLGEFALPVEVIPMNRTHLLSIFEKKNLSPKLRKKEGKVYTTDSKNNIIDLDLKCIENKKEMANFLKSLVGVVEHGLFLEMTDIVIVGKKDGADVLVKE